MEELEVLPELQCLLVVLIVFEIGVDLVFDDWAI